MRCIVAILSCVLIPSWSEAQVRLPRHDAAVSIGWAGSEYRPSDYDRWRASLFVGANVGHYWTDHLRTELEAGWHSPSNSNTYEEIVVDGLQTSATSRFRVRDLRLALAQSYQFGRNDWVHPFVGAGADIVRRNTAVDRPAQTGFAYNNPPSRPPSTVVIPAHRESSSRVLVQPFVRTGVKMYASERTFFVTELKLGFAPDLDHAMWKIGAGFDF